MKYQIPIDCSGVCVKKVTIPLNGRYISKNLQWRIPTHSISWIKKAGRPRQDLEVVSTSFVHYISKFGNLPEEKNM